VTGTSFAPRILGILCTWCSYSGADGAGQAHIPYPPNVEVVRVMCTGRVDPLFVLEALAGGMDGVLMCGCHPGDCHYINGNCKAMGRMPLLRSMLGEMGIEQDRVRLEWVSASEGARYAQLVEEMTETVRALGPLDWKGARTAPAAAKAV
jgi:F420-non-reducing hydrogenase iron-sulfur subunit